MDSRASSSFYVRLRICNSILFLNNLNRYYLIVMQKVLAPGDWQPYVHGRALVILLYITDQRNSPAIFQHDRGKVLIKE